MSKGFPVHRQIYSSKKSTIHRTHIPTKYPFTPMCPYIPPTHPLCAPYVPLCTPYVPLCTPYAPPTCPLCAPYVPLHAPYAPQLVPDWLRFLNVPTTANQITGIDQAHYHKILIFFPTTSLKCLRAARIDQLADSNETANSTNNTHSAVLHNSFTPLIVHISQKYLYSG